MSIRLFFLTNFSEMIFYYLVAPNELLFSSTHDWIRTHDLFDWNHQSWNQKVSFKATFLTFHYFLQKNRRLVEAIHLPIVDSSRRRNEEGQPRRFHSMGARLQSSKRRSPRVSWRVSGNGWELLRSDYFLFYFC